MGIDEPLDGPFGDEPRKRCESYMFRYDVQVLLNRMVAELAENQPEDPIPFLTNLLGELQTEREQQQLQQKALHASIFETITEEEAAGAALRIQSAARARQARKRVDAIREERGVPKQPAGAAAPAPAEPPAPAPPSATPSILLESSPEELEAAALKIQSLQRGRAARARVDELKKAQAAGVAPQGGVVEVSDVAEAFQNLSPEEAEAAAIRIQAVHRGRMARKKVATKRSGAAADAGAGADAGAAPAPAEEELNGEDELEVEDVLEAFGNLSPDEAAAAAIRIQAIQRGRIARKQMAVTRASMRDIGNPPPPPAE